MSSPRAGKAETETESGEAVTEKPVAPHGVHPGSGIMAQKRVPRGLKAVLQRIGDDTDRSKEQPQGFSNEADDDDEEAPLGLPRRVGKNPPGTPASPPPNVTGGSSSLQTRR